MLISVLLTRLTKEMVKEKKVSYLFFQSKEGDVENQIVERKLMYGTVNLK